MTAFYSKFMGRCDVLGPEWAAPGPWLAWRDGFAPRAMAQQELDKRSWAKRLDSLENELQTEPDRIRGPCQVKARRIEPVGLVYLWPLAG